MAYYINMNGTSEVINSLNRPDGSPVNKKLYSTESEANSALSALGDSNFVVVSE